MILTPEQRYNITQELKDETRGRFDGAKRNLLLPICPWCGKDKCGIYIGPPTKYKTFGSSNCFKCGHGSRTLQGTLEVLNRLDLLPADTASLDDESSELTELDFEDELDMELKEVEMPSGYKRTYKSAYMRSRGFQVDDYETWEIGTTRGINPSYNDYVIIPVIEEGKKVAFIARSVYSKEYIDEHYARTGYRIMRYKNSNETIGTAFSKLLFDIDRVIPMETDSVLLVEGVFDCISLVKKLELFDSHQLVPLACFGKKVSMEQMLKLQQKGVTQVVIGFDNDAKETTMKVAEDLEKFFDVLIADIPSDFGKDWDEMDVEEIYDVLAYNLKTIREFNLS